MLTIKLNSTQEYVVSLTTVKKTFLPTGFKGCLAVQKQIFMMANKLKWEEQPNNWKLEE